MPAGAYTPRDNTVNTNTVDACYFLLDPAINTNFRLHTDPHGLKQVIPGVYTPSVGDILTGYSTHSGEFTARVVPPDEDTEFTDVTYTGLIKLDTSPHELVKGDSGTPYFHHVGGNRYQIVGMHVGGPGSTSYAYPAALAESGLGITFGNDPPVAQASATPSTTVRPRQRVRLNSEGSLDPDGDELTYKWKQIMPPDLSQMVGVAIEGSDRPVAAFEAPDATVSLIFELEVTDVKGDIATDRVTVEVNNRAPTASAGYSQVAAVNAMVTLAGGASDMDIGHVADMEVLWSQKSGTLVTLASPIVNGAAVATNRTFTPTAVGDYGFKLRVTDPGDLFAEDEMTVHCCPATGTSQWFDTGETRGCGSTKEKHQTRLNNGVTEYQWLSDPEPLSWSGYSDTGITRNTSYCSWTNTNEYRGSGASRDRKQTRTVSWEKERTRTSQCNDSQSRWVADSITETRWVDDPEPVETWPPTWTDTGNTRNRNVGGWTNLTTTRDCGADRERKQSQLITWQKEQSRTSNLGNTRTKWIAASDINFRWSSDPGPETWGGWKDTGNTRENEFDYSVEKEQRRTSSCGNTETRWVGV